MPRFLVTFAHIAFVWIRIITGGTTTICSRELCQVLLVTPCTVYPVCARRQAEKCMSPSPDPRKGRTNREQALRGSRFLRLLALSKENFPVFTGLTGEHTATWTQRKSELLKLYLGTLLMAKQNKERQTGGKMGLLRQRLAAQTSHGGEKTPLTPKVSPAPRGPFSMQSLSPSPPAASCWTRQCSSRPRPHPSAPGDNSRSYSRSVRRLWPPAYTEGEKLHERALSLQTLLQMCGEPAGTVCRAEKHRGIICQHPADAVYH